MKKVLSLLVSFVFLQTQSWALSGGPNYNGNSKDPVITGTYAGVLVPQFDPLAPAAAGTASIGLFSVIQPTQGFATGTLVAFVNGAIFTGTIQGVIDPKGSVLNGVIDAQSAFDVVEFIPSVTVTATGTTTTFTQTSFPVFAEGNITAEVKTENNNASTSTRINGQASLDIFYTIDNDGTPNITQTTTFEVDGFKQIDPLTGL